MTSVATLIAAKTADTLRAELLTALAAAGFPVASWQPGSVPRDLVFADATALAQLHSVVAELAMAAFLDDAEKEWLTLFAASRYEGTAVAWGRADTVRYSISTAGRARGMVSTQDVSIRCSSWLELLQRSRVLLAPALRSELDGFIYRAQSWGATLSTALQAFSYKPGGLFQAMWQQMVKVQIPATLTPNALDAVTMGDEIPIAHDAASVATYAPARGPQHLDVEGVNINAIGSQAH
jgi:hypothetical protein